LGEAIDELGEMVIRGVPWARELEGPTEQTKMSVFFKFPE
jgi:hypothetical protein